MKTVPLFDDWMLDFHQDIVRRFGQPELCEQKIRCEDDLSIPHAHGDGYVNVVRDPKRDVYRFWYTMAGQSEIGGKNFNNFLCYMESTDGFNWTRPNLGFAKRYGFDDTMQNCVGFDVYPTVISKVTLDTFESNPARRYKLVTQHIEGHILDNNITGRIYVSSDGIDWKIIEGSQWYTNRMGSDCDNNLIFNPISGRYQIICRPSCLDRRIAIVESEDLVHWTDPQVVLHPDTLDEPLLQFYSMTQYWYHDYFVGFMQRQHIASSEASACKWLGKVDSELTYSFDGRHWNRTDRQPLIPRRELGKPGCEQIYTNSMIEEANGGLRFYSGGHDVEHCAEAPPETVNYNIEVLIHTIRRDGFVYLEPKGGYGTFSTRILIPRNDQLRINVNAPNGYMWMQVSDSKFNPLPGFSFDDSIPFSGDDIEVIPRWKGGKSAADLRGRNIRLEFRLFQARVYAIHWDFQIQYGDPVIERI